MDEDTGATHGARLDTRGTVEEAREVVDGERAAGRCVIDNRASVRGDVPDSLIERCHSPPDKKRPRTNILMRAAPAAEIGRDLVSHGVCVPPILNYPAKIYLHRGASIPR